MDLWLKALKNIKVEKDVLWQDLKNEDDNIGL
jgi:hypothetical protein